MTDVLERSGPRPTLRAASLPPGAAPQATMPTLTGHFAVFNVWTEVNSLHEGHFMERIAPGAFSRTFASRSRIRVTFQHGKDPQAGDKVLGPIERLEEDGIGAAYEVPLLDTSYNRDLLPGLEAGLYGSSFRFALRAEDFNRRAARSDYNPQGLPERTILDAEVMEFGPVTWPQYGEATAGLRSLWTPARRARALVLLRCEPIRSPVMSIPAATLELSTPANGRSIRC